MALSSSNGQGPGGCPEELSPIREGWLFKKRSRSSNPFNQWQFTHKWFKLTKRSLIYYDNQIQASQGSSEKGLILTNTLLWVEVDPGQSTINNTPISCLSFLPQSQTQLKKNNYGIQVGYSVGSKSRVLRLQAQSQQERDLWIQAIRKTCEGRVEPASVVDVNPPAPLIHASSLRSSSSDETPLVLNNVNCDLPQCLSPDNNTHLVTNPSCFTNIVQVSECSDNTCSSSSTTPPNICVPQTTPFMSSPQPEMTWGTAPQPNKPRDKSTSRRVVVALYPFKSIEAGDLSLVKGEEYEIVDDSQEHWWQVKDKNGSVGYIPSNYVKEKEFLGLQKYDWYVGDLSRQQAETLLRFDDKEGCFLIRNSSTKGLYTLSLYTKVPHPQVKHYHIKQNARAEFYLSEKHCCPTIPDLITYHRHNSGGLASRLKNPPSRESSAPATAGLSHDKWEIDPSELMLHEELGSGQFGVVRRGKWRGCIDVAVKMMKEGTMSEDEFIEEAKVMTQLQHPNLVQLYGVCSKHRPIYIVTEYMKHGALLHYLRRHETSFHSNIGLLLDIVIQVCKGMAYLERHNYIHRDLAARNCLVGAENVVKVADFGLARYVLDDQYTSSGGTKFPIKWAPPEVLNWARFSSKSDIWAYGVLIWEVFTCGKMPYGRMKNTEVVERVQRGQVLDKPKNCPKEAYEVMRNCWRVHPDERPSFRTLKEELVGVAQILLVD